MVPYARGNDAVPAGHATHLAQSHHGIRHEVDDELSQGSVEGSILEREVLGGRTAHIDVRLTLPGCGDEALGRIDC